MDVAIAGEGELLIRYIDKDGRTLMQERLVVSGSATMEARHLAPHTLQTTTGPAEVVAVLGRQSNPRQRVTFDGQAPGAYARRRCKEIGCPAKIAADAARGRAPEPAPRIGISAAPDDAALVRLAAAAARGRRR